jgi:DNA invertase Pin-like site-specific DNA recombinase
MRQRSGAGLSRQTVPDGRGGSSGKRTVPRASVVESPNRFSRDLMVQLAGHDHLRGLGLELIPASAPDFFLNDTPTAVLVRQVLGAISQFEKATLVTKLKAARDRKRQRTGKAEGRKSHAEMNPDLVALAKRLRRKRRNGAQPSLRDVSADLARRGYLNVNGSPYSACSIASMVTPGGPLPRARRQSDALR